MVDDALVVVVRSGYFGFKLHRKLLDAEVLANFRELGVVAFEDEAAERTGHVAVVAARATFRAVMSSELVKNE